MAAALAKDEENHKKHGEEEGCSSSHFLVVAYSMQGHINPARTLAHRLAQIAGCTATLSVPLSGHRRMFPSSSEAIVSDGLISYLPFSDGIDDGTWPVDSEDRARRREANFRTLSAVIIRLAAAADASRPPVTCVVCTLSMPMIGEVARAHGLPLAVYWIQPATVLAAYYHYFHGHDELLRLVLAAGAGDDDTRSDSDGEVTVTLPGLHRALRAHDLPSFFFPDKTRQDGMSELVLQSMRELFQQIDDEKPAVLVNTFAALEDVALAAAQRPYTELDVEVFAVGPAVPLENESSAHQNQIHLFRHDEEAAAAYMEWLDLQPAKSVVYLSFGSLLGYTRRQAEEILGGLRSTGRPYLWVVRKEGRAEEVDDLFRLTTATASSASEKKTGTVVEWCDQQRVLGHAAVGCFVTHCGWNSTLEAVASGVPMVAVPCWSDQPVNAWLVEEWEVGVRAERDGEGTLAGDELARCVEMVMGGAGAGDRAAKVRKNADGLKERARQAVDAGGPLETSLRRFVECMRRSIRPIRGNT